MLLTLAWLALVLVHTPPALATFSSRLRQRMYGVEDGGTLGVILTHRGVLFLAIAALCAYAAFAPDARRAASLAAAISVVGFLIIYVTSGAPERLRSIALTDAVAVIPLIAVSYDAWLSNRTMP